MEIAMRICILIVLLNSIFFISGAYSQDEEFYALGDKYGCIVLGAGGFIPTTGTGGLSLHGGYYAQRFSRFLIGGEISYKKFRSKLFWFDDVEFTNISLTSVFKYVIPGRSLQPYLGLYALVGFNSPDDNDTPGIVMRNSTGASYGLGLILGTNSKLSDNVILFLEGRYGGDWMRTEISGYNSDIVNYGGILIMGGFMFLI
jgi:hypothetical protein